MALYLTVNLIIDIISPQMQSQSIYFSGGHAPRPSSISMLCMLIVPCTIAKGLHFNYVAQSPYILSDGLTTQK